MTADVHQVDGQEVHEPRPDTTARSGAPFLFLAGLLFAANAMAHPVEGPESERFPPVNVEDRIVLYPITGRNTAELRAQLENHGPLAAEPGHGRTRSEFVIAATLEPTHGACHLGAAAISLRNVMTLPQWTDRRGASADTVDRWVASLALLERHEDGHRGHAVHAARTLRDALAGLAPQRDCRALQRTVDREFQRVARKLEMRANRYDARTGNGLRDDPLPDAGLLPDQHRPGVPLVTIGQGTSRRKVSCRSTLLIQASGTTASNCAAKPKAPRRGS